MKLISQTGKLLKHLSYRVVPFLVLLVVFGGLLALSNKNGFHGFVSYADATSNQGTATCTVTVVSPTPTTCGVSNENPLLNQAVTYTASGGSAPYTWTPSSPSMCSGGTGTTNTCTFTTTGPYLMTVLGADGTTGSCRTVNAGVSPGDFITATPARVNPGSPSSVSWSALNVSSCTMTKNGSAFTPPAPGNLIPNSTGELATSTIAETISQQTIYRLTCDGVTSTATVNVTGGQNEF